MADSSQLLGSFPFRVSEIQILYALDEGLEFVESRVSNVVFDLLKFAGFRYN